jgi:hypothetical protein
MPRDWDYHERRGTPLLGLLVALAVVGLGFGFASMEVTHGAVDCGTALSQRGSTVGSRVIRPGATPSDVGRVGCDKAIIDRRLQLSLGVVLGLGFAAYLAVSSAGARGVGGP